MSKLKISPNLSLPIEAVTQTFAILAKRGVGKTYTASVMVEEMLKNNLQTVVVDPIGVWWGLRSSVDGKSAGLPIVIAGGDHADVPIEPTNGETLADLVISETLSLVIDLSLFRKNQQTQFMTDFMEKLYHSNRSPLHLVLDEADAFAPQRPFNNQARMLGAAEDLVRRGRARGIGVTMITQRPAVLNKDVLTQIEVLVAMRLVSPQDRKAVDEWIKVHGEEGQREELMESLPSLPIGTAWFWSPGWLDMFRRVKVRERETFDSSKTPKVGEKIKAAKAMANVDLEAIKKQLASTIERKQAEDPAHLRRKVAELEKELAKSSQVEVKTVIKEVPILKPEIADKLQKTATQLIELGNGIIGQLKGVRSPVVKFEPKPLPEPAPLPPKGNMRMVDRPLPPVDPAYRSDNSDKPLSLAERKILSVLIHYPNGRTINQVAIMSGYAINGGGFRNALSSLRSRGYIDGRGNLQITSAGMNAMPSVDPMPTGTHLIEYWKSRLSKAERLILETTVAAYPSEIGIETVAEQTGYSANGGGFRNALSKLRTLELIEGRAEIRANENFFV